MELEQALKTVRAAGYRVSKPKARVEKAPDGIETVNPFGHAFPHAKLRNVKLTSITRLGAPYSRRIKLIDNNDARNFAFTRRAEITDEQWRGME